MSDSKASDVTPPFRLDKHPLVRSAWTTFDAARTGLEEALAYQGATNYDDVPRMQLACGAIASSCDALKAAANAYGAIVARVSRMPKGESST